MMYMVKVMYKDEFEAFAKKLLEGDTSRDHVHGESGLMLEDVKNYEDWYTPYGQRKYKNRERKIFVKNWGQDSNDWLLKQGFVPAA